MSLPNLTLNQAAGVEAAELDWKTEKTIAAPAAQPFWKKILKAKSPGKPVAEYREHPANFDRSDGLAQVLRGAEGILGSLDLAILDVLVGGARWIREKGGSGHAATGMGHDNPSDGIRHN
jgi:hypothetical protein